jgi:hypothetical protein
MFEMVYKRDSVPASDTDATVLPPTQLTRRRRNRQVERNRRRNNSRALSCRCASSRCPPLCYLVVPGISPKR